MIGHLLHLNTMWQNESRSSHFHRDSPMRHLFLLTVLVLTACASTPSSNDEQNIKAKRYETVQEASKESAPDDVICTYEQKVGSHMKTAVCASRTERDRMARNAQEEAEKLRRKGRQSGAGNN